jgi:hypothetical protein
MIPPMAAETIATTRSEINLQVCEINNTALTVHSKLGTLNDNS